MLIHLQKYDFKVIHKRGKDLVLADTLSRAYLPLTETDTWDAEINSHVNLITSQINITDKALTDLKKEIENDSELKELIKVIKNGWPKSNKNLNNTVKLYAKYKSDLTIVNGVIYKDQRCLIQKLCGNKYWKKYITVIWVSTNLINLQKKVFFGQP